MKKSTILLEYPKVRDILIDDLKISVLYVGSDEFLFKELSANKSFHLSHFSNGKWAYTSLVNDKEFPEVIVCESVLYGMSGFELHKDLYQEEKFHHIPFILIHSGQNYDEVKTEGFKLGIDDVYEKPVEVDKLSIRIALLRKFKKERFVLDISRLKVEGRKISSKKRWFDIILSSVIIILLLPLFIILIVAICLESNGGFFYYVKKVGLGYKVFSIYKFRTMYVDADQRLKKGLYQKQNDTNDLMNQGEIFLLKNKCVRCEELEFLCSPLLHIHGQKMCERQYFAYRKARSDLRRQKTRNDLRFTRVGRLIERYKLNNIPQLFNVLRGDMSIVGNKPISLFESELLTSDKWADRFKSPAGIVVPSEMGVNVSGDRCRQIENNYAHTNSLFNDIKLILKFIKNFGMK